MNTLYLLLKSQPLLIQYYLNEFIFPQHLKHQNIKFSACGVDLVGDMLFKHKIGFSGTPSSLIPIELGKCQYEQGSDGEIIHTLTNPEIVDVHYLSKGWSVKSFLKYIANAKKPKLFQMMMMKIMKI
eukprot:UN08710